MDGWLPVAFLRTGEEMARVFHRYPGVVQRAALLGVQCASTCNWSPPELPPFPVPNEATYLRHLTRDSAARRYGPRDANPGVRAVARWVSALAAQR